MVGEILNLYRTNVIMKRVGGCHKATHWYPDRSEECQDH